MHSQNSAKQAKEIGHGPAHPLSDQMQNLQERLEAVYCNALLQDIPDQASEMQWLVARLTSRQSIFS
jgi:hypothetical protein